MMTRYLKISFWAVLFGLVTPPSNVSAASITEKRANIGYECEVSTDYSTGMGYQTTTSGDNSTAMGYKTTANGDYSTAMGTCTTASGDHSTAMGYHTTASGSHSISMGANTTASGLYSTAIGTTTTASEMGSIAIGLLTVASAQDSTVLGCGHDSEHKIINDIRESFMVGYMNSDEDTSPEFFVKDGAVGVGTKDPREPLEVGGTGRAFFGDGAGDNRKGLLIDGIQGSNAARLEASRTAVHDQGLEKLKLHNSQTIATNPKCTGI